MKPKPFKPALKYVNNWEADEYYLDGRRVSDMKKVWIYGKEYKVKSSEVSVPYNDMGHAYTGVSKHFYVEEEVFGIKMKCDLNEIVSQTEVIPLVYRLEGVK